MPFESNNYAIRQMADGLYESGLQLAEINDLMAALPHIGFRLGESIDGIVAKYREWREEQDKISSDEALQKFKDSISELNKAILEQSQNGKISQETYSNLISKGEDYAKIVDIINGELVLAEESALNFRNEQTELAIRQAITSGATIEQVAELLVLQATYERAAESSKTLTEQMDLLQSSYKTAHDAIKEYNENGLIK